MSLSHIALILVSFLSLNSFSNDFCVFSLSIHGKIHTYYQSVNCKEVKFNIQGSRRGFANSKTSLNVLKESLERQGYKIGYIFRGLTNSVSTVVAIPEDKNEEDYRVCKNSFQMPAHPAPRPFAIECSDSEFIMVKRNHYDTNYPNQGVVISDLFDLIKETTNPDLLLKTIVDHFSVISVEKKNQ